MAQATSTTQIPTTEPQPPRQKKLGEELEINLVLSIGVGFAVTAVIYAIAFPFQDSYLGSILWQRGPTQFFTTWGTAIVAYYCVQKLRKVNQQQKYNSQVDFYPEASLADPQSSEVQELETQLSNLQGIMARRARRVLTAYMQSGDQETASEQFIDDSETYSNASTLSYSFPKILLTVIPLTGFVGTVLGIGNAVRGFTNVLGGSQGTEELVDALGGVTAGLGTAFDTTFLALVLSVPFLIFQTVVEQRETRLLQSVDTAITENLISRFDQGQGESAPVTEASFREGIEEAVEELGTQVHSAVQTGFEEYIPRPEVLVEPAQRYAEQAAHSLAEQFVSEVSAVQNTTSQLMERLEEITETSAQRRQEFLDVVGQQQRQNQASLQSIIGEVRNSSSEFLDAVNQQQQRNQESLQSIISEVRNSSGELVQQMQESGNEVSRGLQSQAQQLTEQLDRALERTTSSLSTVSEDLQTQARQISQELAEAANALNQRVTSLEQYAAQVSEVQELERTLNQTLETLSSSQQLQNTLTELQRTLEQLQPIIEKAQRPRRLRVVEEEED